MHTPLDCSLCTTPMLPHHQTEHRAYVRCSTCELVVVPERFHLDSRAERAVYDLHENNPDDLGYRRFLGRAVDPLLARLSPGSRGLDFGCGPGPTVSRMLSEAGHECLDYDPFYFHDPALLEQRYDFVVCTEVVEHLRDPAATLAQLFALAPIVVVMTKRTTHTSAFAGWHYIQDPTHIAFYGDETMRWLARHFGRGVSLISADVAVFE